ncbi:MAG: hypothetical protein U9O66_01375 [Patescibacteria group bacterium]|nr:hypothetical protein [Patescibacteria group bacterium]
MKQNTFLIAIKYISIDLIGDILLFPLWWYTKGLKKTVAFCVEKAKNAENALGLKIWLTSIFKPMYAQYDWQGKIISFFMRIFQIIIRSILFIISLVFIFILPIIWIIFPVFIIFQIVLIITV